LRKIVRGGTDDSFGIEVAKLAGVPDKVISRAKEVLSAIESGDKHTEKSTVEMLGIAEEKKVKANELRDAIMSVDISTLTPLEAMNELFMLQKKVGELSED
jgi:DNA mismatch repair protein MutS